MKRAAKDALSFLVQEGAVNELALVYEDPERLPEALRGVSYVEARAQIARWLWRLPGPTWHLGLPQPGDAGQKGE